MPTNTTSTGTSDYNASSSAKRTEKQVLKDNSNKNAVGKLF